MSLDQAAWAEIARLWLEGVEPLGRIAARFGISHQKIMGRARCECWPQRGGAAGGGQSRSIGGAVGWRSGGEQCESVAARSAEGGGVVERVRELGRGRKSDRTGAHKAMVERLFDAMDTKLSAIEQRIAAGGDATPADSERTTRALNTLVRSLEKLSDYEGKIMGKVGRKDGKRRHAAVDPERRRQELARRIERLLKR